MLNAFIDRCCRWINLLIALALAVMVVMVFGNVVLRYAFNSGIASLIAANSPTVRLY